MRQNKPYEIKESENGGQFFVIGDHKIVHVCYSKKQARQFIEARWRR